MLERMRQIKERHGKTGEVKWKNAKSRRGRVHREYIDLLFEMVEMGRIHLHIRFSRMSEYDHKLSGPRRKVDTVSKAFYQLLLHRPLKFYREKADIYIYPDDGECTIDLPNNIGALHREEWRMTGENGYNGNAVRCITPRSSEREPMLQLLDVTLGALAAYRNGRHLDPEISQTKRELAIYAFEKTGWPDIEGSCNKRKRKLSRWNVIPSLKKEKGGRDRSG
ncbi:hypothetical protein ABIA16_003545 [Sinorhizobium fredii]